MNCRFTNIVLLAIFISPVAIALGSDRMGFEVRIVRDMAELSFSRFDEQADQVWVLAGITPGARESELAGYIDGKTGRFVGATGGADPGAFTGTCRVKALLSGTLRQWGWSYRFTEHPFGHDLESQSPYSPLEGGGTAICRLNDNAQGADRFVRVFLIPPEWEQFVFSAWKFDRANGTPYELKDKRVDVSLLVKLLGDENPLLAFTACRALCEGRAINSTIAQSALKGPDRIRTATMVYLLLTCPPPDQGLEVIGDLDWAVDPSEFNGNTVEAIALGAFAAYDPTRPNARPLFDLVSKFKQIAGSQKAPTDASKYISSLLASWDPGEQLSIVNAVQKAMRPQIGANK